ncbi:Magnesium chelatase, subunit ChlI [Lysobacter silvestris]|uniref:Magnesium chelatase, subunit ChlI n=1 Tax=Solilutibacter silvestris TaxID=1645665 RepID=A0A2K1Q1C3_9GAMM|nr:Magnesium chelatase, subunit ChlI [Lysobacter silvestris]
MHIARAARRTEYPARFQLVAAMNPCPCGWAGDISGRCNCNVEMIQRYRGRISGPILDRIDLHVHVQRLPAAELRPDAARGECSSHVRERVTAARNRQLSRAGTINSRLQPRELARDCRLEAQDQLLLETAVERLQLSARAMHRILRVARTIADLDPDLDDGSDIATAHLGEALGYRPATPYA